MTIFVASWGADEKQRARARSAIGSCLPLFPELGSPGVDETAWNGQAHVVWLREPGPAKVVSATDDRVTVVDGVALAPSGDHVVTATELSARPEGQQSDLGELDGHFAVVDAARDWLVVALDTLGQCTLYWCRIGDAWFIANRAEPLGRISETTAIDLDGAAAFLSIGFVMGDRTLIDGVRAVPGGSHWSWRHDQEPCLRRPGDPWRYVAAGRARVDVPELARDLVARCAAVGDWAGEVECSLTGGLDSRVIFALLREAGTPVRYITGGEEHSDDVVVARRIARFAGLTHEVLPTYSQTEVKASWNRLSRKLIAQNDGLVSLWQVIDVMRPPIQPPVALWGVGGSICRAFYGKPRDYVGLSGSALVSRFVMERAGNAHGLMTAFGHDAGRQQVRAFTESADAQGIQPRAVPDAFSTVETHGRWAGANARKTFPTPLFAPLSVRPFLRAALSFSPVRRYSEPLHFGLLRLLAPDLAVFPHPSGRWQSQIPYVNLLGGRAFRSRVRRAGHDPTGFGSSLLETMRPELAARCLDRSSSPLWQVVDRCAFESVMTGDPQPRGRIAKWLFGVATLFEYEALRAESW